MQTASSVRASDCSGVRRRVRCDASRFQVTCWHGRSSRAAGVFVPALSHRTAALTTANFVLPRAGAAESVGSPSNDPVSAIPAVCSQLPLGTILQTRPRNAGPLRRELGRRAGGQRTAGVSGRCGRSSRGTSVGESVSGRKPKFRVRLQPLRVFEFDVKPNLARESGKSSGIRGCGRARHFRHSALRNAEQ